ncbi:MAG: superinfection immunity protein [Aeromicrobium sp.]
MSVIRNDSKTSGAELAISWILTVLTVGYFLPWAVAASRGKSNSGAIAVLNFLLGWTVIGWIIALVMACGSHQTVAVQQPTFGQAPPTTYQDPSSGRPVRIDPATGQPEWADVAPATIAPKTDPTQV